MEFRREGSAINGATRSRFWMTLVMNGNVVICTLVQSVQSLSAGEVRLHYFSLPDPASVLHGWLYLALYLSLYFRQYLALYLTLHLEVHLKQYL